MRTDPPNGEELDRLLAGMKAKVMQRAAQEQPAERRTLIDSILASVLAAGLLLGLGSAGAAIALGALPLTEGGDSPAPGASPSVGPTATPWSFPIETAPPRPESRLGVTCEQVIATADLIAFLGDAGATVSGPASVSPSSADDASLDQLGALRCVWSNGIDPSLPDMGGQNAVLTVLPEGLDAAAEYVELYRAADPTYGPVVQGPRCVAEAGGFCEVLGVIGSTWVEFRVNGVRADGLSDDELRTRFLGVTDPLVQLLSNLEPAGRWEPGAASPTATATCADLAPTADLAAAIGESDLDVITWRDGPRVGQYHYAIAQTGASSCHLIPAGNSDAEFAQIGVLPNGAWGVERYRTEWLADGGQVVPFDAAMDGTAVLRCGDESRACRLDAAVSGDWMSVDVSAATGYEDEPTAQIQGARAHIVDVAAVVAGRIHAVGD